MIGNNQTVTKKNGSSGQARGLTGFSLVELSVVLAIIAVVMGSVIALTSATLEGKSANNSLTKLKLLQQALTDYRIAYNKLPCPADSTLAVSSVSFGVAAATTGNCAGGSPAADIADATAAVGMVPVRTLGLSDEMAIDGWGRRIRYAVSPAFVTDDAFDGVAATSTTARITLTTNENGATLSTTAAFVLVSHGKNGHGAYPGALNGTAAVSPINAGITNANEQTNCKCTATGAENAGADLDSFVQGDAKPDPADPLNHFDDIVLFSNRAALRDGAE